MASVWLFVIYISPIPQILMNRLESQYSSFSKDSVAINKNYHIIVLGGGSYIAPSLPYNDQLSLIALGRLVEGMRIYYLLPNAKLVLSGHSSSGRTSIAKMMTLTALDLNFPKNDTLMITSPGNTTEEAEHYTKRFPTSNVILVTSASHMPRAMKNFEMQGVHPVPAPTAHIIKIDPLSSPYTFKPSLDKIQMMNVLIKEYLGLLYLNLKSVK